MSTKKYHSLGEFWPFYLSEHTHPKNRVLHFIGTCGVFGWVTIAIIMQNYWLLLCAPLNAYGLAWVGHFFIEKNRPAALQYPFYSFACDFIMCFYVITGQIPKQMKKYQLTNKQ